MINPKYVLIADDSAYKLSDIEDAARKLFPWAEIATFTNCNAVLRHVCLNHETEVREHPEDWLILTDMQMPNLEHGDINVNGGRRVLRTLESHKLACPAIVISSETQNDEELRMFYSAYKGSIVHSAMYDTASSLRDLLETCEPL